MIVIATHNNPQNLERLLASMRTHGTDGESVLVCVSGGEDYEGYVDRICKSDHGLVGLEWLPERTNGFETAAWVQAYRLRPADTYLFLQDSVEVTSPGWYRQFVDAGKEAERRGYQAYCIPWVTFAPYLLGVTPAVGQRIVNVYGLFAEPGYGIFGSMFYVTRTALERVDQAGYLNYQATDKIDSEAYERWWALFFHRLGIPMFALNANAYHVIHTTGEGLFGLRKHYHTRNGGRR